MLPSPIPRRSVSREPVSRMQLVFDEEDDGGQEMEAAAADPRTSRGTEERRSGGATAAEEEAAGPPAASWGLGDLLCVCLSLWIFFFSHSEHQLGRRSKAESAAPPGDSWTH